MNDIDSRLRRHASQTPRRPLTSDFTDAVMERTASAFAWQLGRKVSYLKGLHIMKLVHIKRAGVFASIVGVLILTGSTYAFVRWAGFDNGADYGGITQLGNGDTRFWVHAKDCSDEQGKQFYEIKKGAAITPAQITDMIAGTCEYDDPAALFPGVALNGTPPTGVSLNADTYQQALQSAEILTQHYLVQGTVQKVDQHIITVQFSTHSGKHTEDLPLLAGVKAFDKDQPISPQALKAGDPIAMIMQKQATFAEITHHTDQWQDADHTTLPNSSVYGIVKEHHAIYDLSAEGKEFTHLVPDPKDLQGMNSKQASKYTQDPAHLHQEYPLR